MTLVCSVKVMISLRGIILFIITSWCSISVTKAMRSDTSICAREESTHLGVSEHGHIVDRRHLDSSASPKVEERCTVTFGQPDCFWSFEDFPSHCLDAARSNLLRGMGFAMRWRDERMICSHEADCKQVCRRSCNQDSNCFGYELDMGVNFPQKRCLHIVKAEDRYYMSNQSAGTFRCANCKCSIKSQVDMTSAAFGLDRGKLEKGDARIPFQDMRPLSEGMLLTLYLGQQDANNVALQISKNMVHGKLYVNTPKPGAVLVRPALSTTYARGAKVAATTEVQANFNNAMRAILSGYVGPEQFPNTASQRPVEDCSQFAEVNRELEHCRLAPDGCMQDAMMEARKRRLLLAQHECAKYRSIGSACIEADACLLINIEEGWNIEQFRALYDRAIQTRGQDFISGSESWKHAIIVAARFGAITKLDFMLDDPKLAMSAKTVSAPDRLQGVTALLMASRYGHTNCVDRLLAHGRLLVQAGKSFSDGVYNGGYNALLWATSNGHRGVVRSLMSSGIEVGFPRVKSMDDSRAINLGALHPQDGLGGNSLGENALMIAIYRGYTDIVNYILDDSVMPNEVNDGLPTGGRKQPLMYAAETARKDMVQILLSKGARVNDVDEQDKTALLYALSHRPLASADVAELLLSAESIGESIDVVDKAGYHAINYAVHAMKMKAISTGPRQTWEDIVTRIADLMAMRDMSMTNSLLTETSREQGVAVELELLLNPAKRNATAAGSTGARPLQFLVEQEHVRVKTWQMFDAVVNMYNGAYRSS